VYDDFKYFDVFANVKSQKKFEHNDQKGCKLVYFKVCAVLCDE